MPKTALFQYRSNPYSQSVTATYCKPPFGMLIKERAYTSDSYRFGFNGMEKIDEVIGEGNSLDFGARIYDSRLGRFLSIDPISKKFPYLTPFQFASNSPIENIDLDGLEGISKSFMASIGANMTLQKSPKISIITGAGVALKINNFSGEIGSKGNITLEGGEKMKYHLMSYASAGIGNTLGFKTYATTPTSNVINTSTPFDFKPNVGDGNSQGHLIKDGFIGFGVKYDIGNISKSASGISSNSTFALGPISKKTIDQMPTSGSPSFNYNLKTTEISIGGSEMFSSEEKTFSLNISMANTRFTSYGAVFEPKWSWETNNTTSINYTKMNIEKSTFKTLELHSAGISLNQPISAGFVKEKGSGKKPGD